MYLIIKKKKKKAIYEVIFNYDVINIFKSIGPVLILRNQNVCVCVCVCINMQQKEVI